MSDSIEAFVQKLQQEGVQAGRTEAQKLMAEAQAEAERIISEAHAEAERIVKAAKAEAEDKLKQGTDELKLAARDALLRLRQTLTDALSALLRRASAEALAEKGFLTKLLHDVVMQYARKDAEGSYPIEIHVSDEDLEAVTNWALQEMTQHEKDGRAHIDLKGRLKSAGFEYSAGGGTVEVTPESISGVLSEMIAPRLREVVDKAAGQQE